MDINQNVESVLVDMGLSKNEAKIYLTMLDIGSATASEIAKKSNVQRTNVYDALDRMLKKGMASFITHEQTKYFSACDPEIILHLQNERQERFKQILPVLKIKDSTCKNRFQASVLEGIKGIRSILDDIIITCNQKDTFYCWGLPKDTAEKMKGFVGSFHRQRIQKRITQYHLYNTDAKERIQYLRTLDYTFADHLDKEYDTPASTIVYADKVALFLWEDEISSVLIQNNSMAKAYRKYFSILWKLATGEYPPEHKDC